MDSRKGLHFHIEVDDYFGTLATVLDLLRQSLEKGGYPPEDSRVLIEIKDDLVYLQEYYKINKN